MKGLLLELPELTAPPGVSCRELPPGEKERTRSASALAATVGYNGAPAMRACASASPIRATAAAMSSPPLRACDK